MNKRGRWGSVPIFPDNWPPEPETEAAFEDWLAKTRSALKDWLDRTRRQAQDNEPATAEVAECTAKAGEIWSIYEPITDMQTGTIHDKDENEKMNSAMAQVRTEGRKLHKLHHTWYKHLERRYADMCWEDFLYYQNVWNRKHFVPAKEYFETQAEKDSAKLNNKETNEQEDKGRTRSKAKGKTKRQHPKPSKAKASKKNLYRPKEDMKIPYSEDDHDGGLKRLHFAWHTNMLLLYTRFKLGHRKQIPDAVDPDNAHRYSQSLRGTNSRATSPYQTRSKHLVASFSRRKRKAGQTNETTIQIDEEALKRCKKDDEDRQDPSNTRALLPSGHVTYHGSKASSFDWPTSFEADAWGDQITVVESKKNYLYEQDSNIEDLSETERSRRTDATGRVRQIEKKPRYKMIPSKPPRQIEEFVPSRNADGTIKGRDTKGRMIGTTVKKTKDEMVFKLVNGERVELPPRFAFERTFRVRVKTASELGSRKTILADAGKRNELSDSEDEDHPKTSVYYQWSGNANPDRLGGALDEEMESGVESLIGSDPGESEDDSEDDQDVFRKAYEEGIVAG
jgi:hypothetical protein